MKVLVVIGHNSYDRSVQNRKLASRLAGVKDVAVLNLWERYAARDFRLTEEQLRENVQLVLAADRVVLQFPMHWYSAPWCVKRWVDQVFSAGPSSCTRTRRRPSPATRASSRSESVQSVLRCQ